jgi:ABC-type glycerol-3-phosphate transport system substrate-binding protein
LKKAFSKFFRYQVLTINAKQEEVKQKHTISLQASKLVTQFSRRNSMKSKLKGFITLLLALLVSTSVAQDAPEPIVNELGTGGTQISFWNGLSGSDGVTLNDMLTQFVTENTDVSVRTEIIDWNTLYPKIQAAFVAGEPPDVFVVHASEVEQFYSYGMLKDLSYLYDTNGGTLPTADFAQPGFDGILVDGVPYGVMLDNHGRGTWANVGLFEAAGVEVAIPNNYDDTVAMLQKLTLDANGNNAASPDFDSENIVQWGTSMEWMYVDFLSYLWQHGGATVSEDGTTATINSEEAKMALQKMHDLIYKYHVSPAPAGFDAWQSWAGGTVAIVPTGTWFRNFAEDQTDITGQALPFFQFGAQPATWFGAHVFMIPASLEGEKLAAVEKMIKWVTDNQIMWAASGQVPARVSVQEELDPENYPSNITIGKTFQEYGRMEIRNKAILELQTAIDPEISAALNNEKTIDQALADAAERMQQVLDRNQ